MAKDKSRTKTKKAPSVPKAKRGGAKPEEQRSDGARVLISKKYVKDLADQGIAWLARAADAAGSWGQAISDAVQSKGLNGPAFRIAHRLYRKGKDDPVKLRSMLDDFDYYRECLGLDKMKAADMFLDRKGGVADQGTAEETGGEPPVAESEALADQPAQVH